MPINNNSKIPSGEELMLRQVHPKMVSKGRPSSSIFRPTNADNGHLSADRSTLITPREAYERYLENKRLQEGGGTYGVSVQEFAEFELVCYSDPVPDNAAHALVDYASHGSDKEEGLAKLAYAKAIARGKLHPTP